MNTPLLLVLALATPAPPPVQTSYEDAHARVFANPHREPPTDAFSPVPELGMALAGPRVLKAFGRIVSQPVDFKDDSQKVVHRWGVCGEVRWDMDGESHPYGGLFTPGTSVPGLVRFATGTNRTRHFPLAARTWGVAIKLFPSRNTRQPVETVNVSLFDQYGLDGQARPHFMQPLEDDPPLFFTNHIRAQAPQSQPAVFVLGRFDRTPLFRSLRPVAQVDEQGQKPFNVQSPSLLQLHVRHSPRQVGDLPGDYRNELMAYAPAELVFDVVLPAQAGNPSLRRVGTVTVGRMVMSPTCDGALHFYHPPTPADEVIP
jgi:hypothetical protein